MRPKVSRDMFSCAFWLRRTAYEQCVYVSVRCTVCANALLSCFRGLLKTLWVLHAYITRTFRLCARTIQLSYTTSYCVKQRRNKLYVGVFHTLHYTFTNFPTIWTGSDRGNNCLQTMTYMYVNFYNHNNYIYCMYMVGKGWQV